MKWFSIFSFVIIFLSSLAYTPDDREIDSYFPIKDGFKWTYLVKEKENVFKQEVICRISPNGDKINYDFILETNSIRKTKYYYKISNDTIYSIKVDVNWNVIPCKITIFNSPAIPVFLLNRNSRNNTKLYWEGKLHSFIFNKHLKINSEIKCFENIDTPIGILKCLKVITTYKHKNKTEQYIAWYAKNIGLVKLVSPKHCKEIIAFSTF